LDSLWAHESLAGAVGWKLRSYDGEEAVLDIGDWTPLVQLCPPLASISQTARLKMQVDQRVRRKRQRLSSNDPVETAPA